MPRFTQILASSTESKDPTSLLTNFHHFSVPALAHLLALVLHPPPWFPPPNTGILILDGLHLLIDIAYPRYSSSTAHNNNSGSINRSEAAKWAAGRRYSILGTLVAALKKLAALHDMAVLVTTGCATRMRPGTGLGAVLVPGLGGMEWESGVSNRLLFFRDFPVQQAQGTGGGMQDGKGRRGAQQQQQQKQKQKQSTRSARFIGVGKLHGTSLADEGDVGHVIEIELDVDGLREVKKHGAGNKHASDETPADEGATTTTLLSSLPRPVVSPVKARKRKLHEIADSDEEISSEYGWLAEDEVAAEGLIDEGSLADEGGAESGQG